MGFEPVTYDTNVVPTPSINQLTDDGAQGRLNNKKKKMFNADTVIRLQYYLNFGLWISVC